jgi:DNA ligase-1
VREQTLATRRAALEELVAPVADPRLQLSPLLPRESWAEGAGAREERRARTAEGLMLKRRSSRYGVGRQRDDERDGHAPAAPP